MAQTKPWALRCYQVLTKARVKVSKGDARGVARKDVKGDDRREVAGVANPNTDWHYLPDTPR